MKKVEAFRCEYCTKIYENRGSAANHESKCYFNPVTASCASCSFLDRLSVDIAPGHFTEFQVCLVNQDISNKNLRTKCPLYHQAEFHEEYDFKINTPAFEFDRELAIERLSDKIKWQTQEYHLWQSQNQTESVNTAVF